MAKTLTYSDAVRLLGGTDSKVVAALDKVAGGAMLMNALATDEEIPADHHHCGAVRSIMIG